jgi:hypothetical protein
MDHKICNYLCPECEAEPSLSGCSYWDGLSICPVFAVSKEEEKENEPGILRTCTKHD